jgi:uncharacterized protein YkwD
MASRRYSTFILPALLVLSLLSACGGGGSGASIGASTPTAPNTLPQEPGAPTVTNDTARDGFNWINYRRAQLGLSTLTRNTLIDTAAQGHSNYQRINNVVSHTQTVGQPGFTGAQLLNRLNNAGYVLVGPYAYGEVISATSNSSGFYQAEELITAIYHRFVMLEPVFKEMGTGASSTTGGYTYFTADLAASNGYGSGLARGAIVTYPFNNQTGVPLNFLSDSESPDPVPGQNEVGYPLSVHANITASVIVTSFTAAPRGGAALTVRQLNHAVDTETPVSAAAIVPLAVLKSATIYDVSFIGTVDGVAVTRSWSFTTK